MRFVVAEQRLDRPLVVSEQEISSLVGEVRAESSEADAVAEEEEEPMLTDNQSEHVGSAAALRVDVESGRAAAQVSDSRANFLAHVEAHGTDRPGRLSDGVLRQRASAGAHVTGERCCRNGLRGDHADGDGADLSSAGCYHGSGRCSPAGSHTGGAAGGGTGG